MGVGLGVGIGRGASTKHLAASLELGMHLKSYNRLKRIEALVFRLDCGCSGGH